jgi:hypothetical protein
MLVKLEKLALYANLSTIWVKTEFIISVILLLKEINKEY